MSASNIDFYRARVEQARAEADAATLEHVRERCLRSQQAWTHLAERAERQLAMRHEQEEFKAKQVAERDDEDILQTQTVPAGRAGEIPNI